MASLCSLLGGSLAYVGRADSPPGRTRRVILPVFLPAFNHGLPGNNDYTSFLDQSAYLRAESPIRPEPGDLLVEKEDFGLVEVARPELPPQEP